ncbi:DUF6531 domain-containing protein [Massilia pinisoli]|uniref:DUF6531 domain-containing protein n=1 Tax=Massilia pinisoli TaxID=1772194 RepID=A0ABT1ZMD8_9BURK|nr:DUF6765 family protein [Massilia pinisoli]MCS0581071.1 DUF6531 domain-containing protein [Massilia pinisoli]
MQSRSLRLTALPAVVALLMGMMSVAHADLPLFPPQPCPPNSSCAPGTPPTTPPTPPGTCGPGHAGSTCGGGGPATNGNGSGINIGAGNPINVINGNKYQREVDMAPLPGTLGLEIVRYYNSAFSRPGASTNLIGRGWKLSYETELYAVGRTLQIIEADGTRIIFNRDPRDASLCASADPANGTVSIVKTARGDEYVWRWTNGRELTFDSKGHLTQILAPGGQFVSLRYSPSGLLTRVTDPQGRSLDLVYPDKEQARAQDAFRGVQSIVSPVGRFVYRYGSPKPAGADIDKRLLLANLVKVEMPAGARTYHYEQAEFPTFLTGISELVTGADGKPAWQRVSTYAYDHDGKANVSVRGRPARLALGKDGKPLQPARLVPGTGIGQVTLEFGAGQTIVTNSLGQKTLYRHAVLAGEYRLLEVRGAGCSACGETNVRYTYDNLARLETTTRLSAAGEPLSAEHQQYDRRGRLASVSTLAYAHGKALPARLKLRYEYDGDGVYPALIVRPSVVPGRFYVTAFRYAGGGALAGLPAEITEQGYLPTLEGTGAAGTIARTLRYRYDGYGQRVEIDGPLPNAANDPGPQNSDITRVRHDARTKLPVRVDAPGGVTMEVLERDAALRPTVTRTTDASAVQTVRVRYNWRGQPEEVRIDSTPADGGPALSQTVRYVHDLNGKLVASTEPGDLTTRFTYDAAGRPTGRTLADGSTVATAYDTEGRRTAATLQDADNRRLGTARYQFDAAGRMTGIGDDLGAVTHATYTADGAVAEVVNAIGVATRFDYAADGMLASRTSAPGTPDEATVSFDHDVHGHQIKLTDANGVKTVRRFDDFGRLVVEANPDRGVTVFQYDASGQVVARYDGRGNEARYRYDLQHHVVAVGTAAAPELTRYRYVGRRLMEVLATPDGDASHATERTSYRYDAFGHVLEEKRWLARADVRGDRTGLTFTTTNSYDAAGRLVTQLLSDGHRLTYRYGAKGALQTVLFDDTPVVDGIVQGPAGVNAFATANGVRQQIERDARGRITAVRAVAGAPTPGWLARMRGWFGGGTTQGTRTVYAQDNRYDEAGRLVDIARTLGQAGTLPLRRVSETYEYDALDRLTGAGASDGTAVRYAYDKGGNRTAETVQAVPVRTVANVPSAATGTRHYLYAPGSNRLVGLTRPGLDSVAGQAANRVASVGQLFDSAWFYRAGGAPFARIGFSSPEATRRIVYDGAHRPTAVYDADGRLRAAYVYDAQGQRVAKTVYGSTVPASGLVRTSLVDGRRATTTYSLYRDQRLAAEADGTGRITAHYVYLDGKPVARIDMVPDDSFLSALWQWVRAIGRTTSDRPPTGASTATIYAIHTDHLGVPQAVTDAAQAIVWQARISPFGQARIVHASARADVGNAFEMNLRLPGQVYDAETGLHQNYFRDFDPALGRYTTPDPMGLAGGINPYLYVGDNPLTNVDPLGLYQSDIHYYMTFFLAMAAGIDYADARTIALATQYVDNNPVTRPLDESNVLTKMLSPFWNQNQLARYHFVLWEQQPNGRAVFSGDTDVTHHQSTQLDQLFAASENAPTQCAKLQFFGEYLHAFEDTFSHRNQNNVPYGVNNGFGHGLSGSDPDYTYDDVYAGNDPIVRSRLWLVRSDRTLEMEKEVFEKLSALPHSGTAQTWAKVEEKVRQFNAITEHEGDEHHFRRKLALLTSTLSQWQYTAHDANGNTREIDLRAGGLDQYSASIGNTNRENNLCDQNGNRLRQEDYPGTILPATACPR